MAFTPAKLLTNLARERCISCLREQPQLFQAGVTPKDKAAVLIPLCVINDEVHILYTLRSSNLKNHSGQVSFPGGKMDKGEDIIDTAFRETEEEIGIPRDAIDYWCTMSTLQGRNRDILITPVVGLIKNFERLKLVPNAEEVEEIFTVPMSALCEKKNHAHLKFEKHILPVYLFGKHKIWGITGLITHFFLQCFLPSDHYVVDFMRKRYEINDLNTSKL